MWEEGLALDILRYSVHVAFKQICQEKDIEASDDFGTRDFGSILKVFKRSFVQEVLCNAQWSGVGCGTAMGACHVAKEYP